MCGYSDDDRERGRDDDRGLFERAGDEVASWFDTVEGDRIRLDIPAGEAKSRWKDEDERGFFRREEEDQDVSLEHSFSGTYR